MRILKMIIVCILIIGGILMMAGCSNGKTASARDVEFLTSSEYWYHYDEATGESEKMSFFDDFTFYWGCECGEPVGNSDCYEMYDFDKETSIIKLYNDYDDMTMEMEVLDHSDYHILLSIDGEIKDYTYVETGLDVADSDKYMAGYSGEFSVLGGNAEEVVLGPFDYDGDVEYPQNAVKTYALADNVEAYTLYTHKHIVGGEVVKDEADHQQITIKEAAENMEYGGHGFIWFNDDLQVEKILFYGDTIVEE